VEHPPFNLFGGLVACVSGTHSYLCKLFVESLLFLLFLLFLSFGCLEECHIAA
jgi:hypothetical protein